MKTRADAVNNADNDVAVEPHSLDFDAAVIPVEVGHSAEVGGRDRRRQQRSEDELIMYLEPDQFVAETSRRVPRAQLSARATAGLWALRVFVVLVSLMVIYTFIEQLG
jgi:hypothetical protein